MRGAACLALLMLAARGSWAASSPQAPQAASSEPAWDRLTVQLPASAALFPAGDGATIAHSYCLVCHSAGMVLSQPPQSEAQWTAIINKMRTAYGAPLPAEQVAPLAAYLSGLSSMSTPAEPRLPARRGAPPDGAAIFEARCLPCHQGNGNGLPGVFPPLAGSSWVTGPGATSVRIVLRGVRDRLTVNGNTYQGVMPSFASALDDGEIAAVLSYVRGQWGNHAGTIDPALVATERAATAARSAPWNGDQDLEQLR